MGKVRSYFLIMGGAALWGFIALFVKQLHSAGFSSMEITAIRALTAFGFLLMITLFKHRKLPEIRAKDLPLFAGTGILSIVFFNWSYFTAIQHLSVSLAVILLYTAPAFVALFSRLFLNERMDGRKLTAVAGTMTGCIFIAGGPPEGFEVSLYGLLAGIGSGVGYALYTLFGKLALRRYSSFSITFYTFFLASAFLFPFSRLWEKVPLFLNGKVIAAALGLGFFPTVLAYLLYTEGLKGVEGSIAAILATIEPIVALILGIILYDESFTSAQWFGASLILASVVLAEAEGSKKRFLLPTHPKDPSFRAIRCRKGEHQENDSGMD